MELLDDHQQSQKFQHLFEVMAEALNQRSLLTFQPLQFLILILWNFPVLVRMNLLEYQHQYQLVRFQQLFEVIGELWNQRYLQAFHYLSCSQCLLIPILWNSPILVPLELLEDHHRHLLIKFHHLFEEMVTLEMVMGEF